MRINKLRVSNYKGFRDSGTLEFPLGFTVIVGQNNSGKTALLEAFRLTSLVAKPHRSLSRDQGIPLDPNSVVQTELSITGQELLQCILAHKPNSGATWLPCPLSVPFGSPAPGQAYLDQLFRRDQVRLKLASINGSMTNDIYPSLDFESDSDQRRSIQVEASPNST
jgi:hypothetical protein